MAAPLTRRASRRLVRRSLTGAVCLLAILNAWFAADLNRHHDHGRHHGIERLTTLAGGTRLALLIAALLLVAAVPGLVRGRHNAWRLALAATAISGIGHLFDDQDFIGLAVAVLTASALVAFEPSFGARSDPSRVRQGLRTLVIGEALVYLYAAIGLYELDAHFSRHTTVPRSLGEAARLLGLFPTRAITAVTAHGVWFVDSVRTLAVVVALAGLVRAVTPTFVDARSRSGDQARIQALLERYGDTSLAYFHLGSDKTWFLPSSQDALISYRLVGNVAVALGAPVGADAARRRALVEFLDHCEANGWLPAFHQVRDQDRGLLEGQGLQLLKIGEEAVVPLDDLCLAGHHRKALRAAIRRVERAGCHLETLAHPLDATILEELADVSQAWLSLGQHRERTFTVGQFNPEYLEATEIVVVRDAHGRIVAFANIIPSYQSGIGNFDLMRRRPDAPNGVMDYLLFGLAQQFRAQGLATMSLGLAPLVGIQEPGVLARLLDALRRHGGATFNFEGLYQYKNKWRPRWEPRYLAYRRDWELPRVGAAVARAGELTPDRHGRRLRTLVQRLPFTAALITFTLWTSTVSALNPTVQTFLIRRFGLSWTDLTAPQLWRIATATITQPRAGFLWSNLIPIIIFVPLAEWRLGTKRSVLVFFLADWLTSLPILVGLRIVGALGNHTALHDALQRDVGTSAATWALAAAIASSYASPQVRRVLLTILIGFLASQAAIYSRLFDFQHVAAALIAIGFVHRWRYQDRLPSSHQIAAYQDPHDVRQRSSAGAPLRTSATDAPSGSAGGVDEAQDGQ